MINVIGFSRGGTHLFWCFISSHSQLVNAKVEINDIVGCRKLGIVKKLYLEFRCLIGIYCNNFDATESNKVYKAVCSWYPSIFFRILRRHDPMKYISNTSFCKKKTVFLVKSIDAQKGSWMRRGATEDIAENAYKEHLSRWKLYAKDHECLFVDYETFCNDPVETTKNIWSWLGLPYEAFPKTIEIKPKGFKAQPDGLNACSKKRRWEFVDTGQIIASLKIDGQNR